MGLKQDIKQRPIVADKWHEVKDIMATHVHGKPPTRIFKTRRPLESTSEYALRYREENYQPITKQPFHTAISAIIEAATHIFVEEIGVNDNTSDYLSDYELRVAGKTFNHKEYIVKFIGKMIESDPNGVLVHIPVHPSEPFIADFRRDLPNFDNIQNQFIDIDIMLVSSDDIHNVNDDELWYYGGEYVYKLDKKGKEVTAPFYWILTAEATQLAVPFKTEKDQYDYRIEDYYFNDLDKVPFDVIGNNAVLEEIEGELVEYHESTYSGAVAIANRVVGIESDSSIVDTRFTYPEKYIHHQPCGHPQCVKNDDPDSPYRGLFVNWIVTDTDASCSPCVDCHGKGTVAPDTSPLGTHIVSKADLFDQDGKFVPLVQYVTPPLESPEYLDKKWRTDYDLMLANLFIINQNMTNQSGESKSYDVRQKVTVITGAVKNIYSIYQSSLNTVQGLLNGDEDIELVIPPDMNIKNSADITIELGEAKNTSSTYTSELTKELLLKKFGSSAENRKIVRFLELNDKLFGFTMDDIIKAKALYGTELTARDQFIHDKAFAILKQLSENEGFISLTDEELKEQFDTIVTGILGTPPPLPPSPIA